MQMSNTLKEEILKAIETRTSESFKLTVDGGLNHFISSEGKSDGLYIGKIDYDGKEFKIYMI
jgi:hypothetical protein